jgi:hypothetical protein
MNYLLAFMKPTLIGLRKFTLGLDYTIGMHSFSVFF